MFKKKHGEELDTWNHVIGEDTSRNFCCLVTFSHNYMFITVNAPNFLGIPPVSHVVQLNPHSGCLTGGDCLQGLDIKCGIVLGL